jgi:hypothetical protein
MDLRRRDNSGVQCSKVSYMPANSGLSGISFPVDRQTRRKSRQVYRHHTWCCLVVPEWTRCFVNWRPAAAGKNTGVGSIRALRKLPRFFAGLGPTHTPRVLVAASALVVPWHPVLFIGSGLSIGSVLFAAKWR